MRTPLRRWFEAVRAFANEHPEHAREMRRMLMNTLGCGALVGMVLTVATLAILGRIC